MVELAEVATYVLGAVSATALSVGAKKAWSLDMRLSRTEDRVNGLQESHTKMSESLSSLQITTAKTCAQMENMVKGMDAMNAKMDANTEHIVKLAMAQVEHGRVLGKLEGGVEALSSRMGAVEGGLKDLSSRMGKVEGSVEALSSRVAGLEARQDKQQAVLEDLKAGQDKQQATLEKMERILMDAVERLSVEVR